MKAFLLFVALLFSIVTFAQTKVTGNVTDNNGVPLLGANIIVTGTAEGTVTDFDGNFILTVSTQPPFNLEISSVGFNPGLQRDRCQGRSGHRGSGRRW